MGPSPRRSLLAAPLLRHAARLRGRLAHCALASRAPAHGRRGYGARSTRRRLQLAAGLLIASGVAGSAKYLGLLGRVITAKGDPVRLDSVLVFCLVPAAAFALIPIGMRLAQLAGIRLGGESGPERFPLAASGFLVLAGCLVPFNSGGTKPEQFERAILPNEGTQALDPLVVGLALLGLALIMRYLPRALAGGLCSLSDWRA